MFYISVKAARNSFINIAKEIIVMEAVTERLELNIPKDVIEHAKDSGISIEEFKKSLEIFGTMQLVSETSSLSRGSANRLSEKVKSISWQKISKNLNL